MSGESAYTSKLTLHFGDSTPEPFDSGPRIGDVTDATEESLRIFRRVLVEPVVESLFAPHELQELSVRVSDGGHPGDVWVRLTACGEVFEGWIYSPTWFEDEPEDGQDVDELAQTAQKLASDVEDWIAESTFGWGQQRIARYELRQD